MIKLIKSWPAILFLTIVFVTCQPHRELDSNNKNTVNPNIILIMTDDQGYGDLSSFGATDIMTPNIDLLATEGSKYTRFYVPQSQCTPSRAGILTGCYPNRVGVDWVFLPHSTTGLNPEEETIADILKPLGYQSGYFGKWHLGHHDKFLPTNQGFDEFFGIPYSNDMWPLNPRKDYTFPALPLIHNTSVIDTVDEEIQKKMTKLLTEKTIDFIHANKDNSFFTILSHPMPHVPLYVSDNFIGKSKRGLYGDVMMELDWSTGKILDTLKKLKIDQHTMLIFMSDNGPWIAYGNHAGSTLGLKEGKETSFEGGIRSPLLIRYPAKIPAGKTIDTPINGIDLLPTIAELEAVMTDKWKLVLPHSYNSLNGRDAGKDGALSSYEKISTGLELYDLISDRNELNNIAGKHPEVLKTLEEKADSIRAILGDKLNGIVGSEVRPLGQL